MTPSPISVSPLPAAAGPDTYAVAEAAGALLRQNPLDSVAGAHYFRALKAMGLHAAAMRFAEQAAARDGGHSPAWAEAAEVGSSTGLIAWASRRRRFAANLRAAAERWPELAALEGYWQTQAADFELHQAADGNYQLLKLSHTEMWRAWMGGLVNHKQAAAAWSFDKSATPIPPPVAFDGAGHGWLLLRMFEATERSFLSYSCALAIVEPDAVALCILFHLHDLQSVLRSPRLRLYSGPNALPAMRGALLADRDQSIPQQIVTCRISAPGSPALQSTCEQLLAKRKDEEGRLLAEINHRLAGRSLAWWRERFAAADGREKPLRVLGLTTRYSTVLRWSMEEMAAAVRAAGHEMQLVMEPDDQSLENRLVERIRAFDPDLILMLSRMRYENPRLPAKIPFVCWDQDNLPCMRTEAAGKSLDAFTYVAGHAAVHGVADLGWPKQNAILCFPGAAAHRYRPRPLTDAEIARYSCDFSYVSNASGAPEALRDQLARNWKPDPATDRLYRHLTDQIIARSRAGERFDHQRLKQFIPQEAAGLGLSMPESTIYELIVSLRTLADRCFRHATLEWVSRFCRDTGRTFRLYGSGWEGHPLLAPYACGSAEPGTATSAIYQASRINLQIIETGLIHSRFLDGVAAGGFFLAREYLSAEERETANAQYALATHARRHGLTVDDLLTTADPDVRRWWELTQGRHPSETPERIASALYLWEKIVPPHIDMPQVDAITFDDEAAFRALAMRFLEDPGLRSRIAAELREQVLAKHSYDARWRQFLAAVRAGLEQ